MKVLLGKLTGQGYFKIVIFSDKHWTWWNDNLLKSINSFIAKSSTLFSKTRIFYLLYEHGLHTASIGFNCENIIIWDLRHIQYVLPIYHYNYGKTVIYFVSSSPQGNYLIFSVQIKNSLNNLDSFLRKYLSLSANIS